MFAPPLVSCLKDCHNLGCTITNTLDSKTSEQSLLLCWDVTELNLVFEQVDQWPTKAQVNTVIITDLISQNPHQHLYKQLPLTCMSLFQARLKDAHLPANLMGFKTQEQPKNLGNESSWSRNYPINCCCFCLLFYQWSEFDRLFAYFHFCC